MEISEDATQASAITYLLGGKQTEAARILLDCRLALILDEAVDAIERKTGREVRLYLMHAELASSRESVDILNDETNPVSIQIKDALNASVPTNHSVQSVGAHVQVGELDPNWREKLASIVDGAAESSGSVFRLISSVHSEANSPTNAYELLKGRDIHNNVLEACKSELLAGNYYHALLEATKSVAKTIQCLSGMDSDGRDLVNKAFGGNLPVLAVNPLTTTTDWSDQEGFYFLLLGMFATVRNMTAHTPKHENPISELEAADFLSFISYIHRRLDRTVKNSENKRRPPKAN